MTVRSAHHADEPGAVFAVPSSLRSSARVIGKPLARFRFCQNLKAEV